MNKPVNIERRKIIKKVWVIPTVIALGALIPKPVEGGSCLQYNPGEECQDEACNHPNPPDWCN